MPYIIINALGTTVWGGTSKSTAVRLAETKAFAGRVYVLLFGTYVPL